MSERFGCSRGFWLGSTEGIKAHGPVNVGVRYWTNYHVRNWLGDNQGWIGWKYLLLFEMVTMCDYSENEQQHFELVLDSRHWQLGTKMRSIILTGIECDAARQDAWRLNASPRRSSIKQCSGAGFRSVAPQLLHCPLQLSYSHVATTYLPTCP